MAREQHIKEKALQLTTSEKLHFPSVFQLYRMFSMSFSVQGVLQS